jgi:hypothetical protein
VVIGRWEEQQFHRLGLHSHVVAVGSITQTSNASVLDEKNLAARYKAIGGQQARERATGSCISPHRHNIEHVMGKVEAKSVVRCTATSCSALLWTSTEVLFPAVAPRARDL